MSILAIVLLVVVAYVGVGSIVALIAANVIRAGTAHLDRPLPPESLRGGQTFGVTTGEGAP